MKLANILITSSLLLLGFSAQAQEIKTMDASRAKTVSMKVEKTSTVAPIVQIRDHFKNDTEAQNNIGYAKKIADQMKHNIEQTPTTSTQLATKKTLFKSLTKMLEESAKTNTLDKAKALEIADAYIKTL